MEKFVDVAYSVHKFQATYAGMIHVIIDKSQWPQVDKRFKLLPPIGKKRGLGRRRKKMLRDVWREVKKPQDRKRIRKTKTKRRPKKAAVMEKEPAPTIETIPAPQPSPAAAPSPRTQEQGQQQQRKEKQRQQQQQ
ncbi:unnamed protein product [Miscanthus lutarioriparius]|uniref:Uncharacterized protein n=1 Tax=Miscanthus lutarioriparius TaxID=422564 RepID=A0A811RFS8_9POAL|nr:unnamed protein product [Miscanthus lutarioriparius]